MDAVAEYGRIVGRFFVDKTNEFVAAHTDKGADKWGILEYPIEAKDGFLSRYVALVPLGMADTPPPLSYVRLRGWPYAEIKVLMDCPGVAGESVVAALGRQLFTDEHVFEGFAKIGAMNERAEQILLQVYKAARDGGACLYDAYELAAAALQTESEG